MKVQFNKGFLSIKSEQKEKNRKGRSNHQRCNICDRLFRAATGFHRFCKTCKADDELFKFSEWLPQA
jgi:hypothetical protein